MSTTNDRLVEHYESIYKAGDTFGQENRLYRAFVAALVSKIGLQPGARVLDAGCGQGYLSKDLGDSGLSVWCSDLSEAGLRSLDRYQDEFRQRRVLADMLSPPFHGAFDLVFQRSCSLFNSSVTADHAGVVDALAGCVKVGGTLAVVYNSNLSGGGDVWFNHTLGSIGAAFTTPRLTGARTFAVNKVDCLVLGSLSFNPLVTLTNVSLARFVRRSFEIVVVAKRLA